MSIRQQQARCKIVEGGSVWRGGDRYFARFITGWVRHARAVWVQFNGPIPKGQQVHHKDEDTFNDSPENLECVTLAGHNACHEKGFKPGNYFGRIR